MKKNRNSIFRSINSLTQRNCNFYNVTPGNAQHIGGRNEQQDAFGFSDISDKELVDNNGVLAAVADGMGGLCKGKEASNLVIKTFLNTFSNKVSNKNVQDVLNKSLYGSNLELNKMAKHLGLEGNIGSTLVAVIVYKDDLHWISVGDSRIYLYRNDCLSLLTEEHIYARDLEKAVCTGHITEEDALNHPDRECLTSYIGIEELLQIDKNDKPLKLISDDIILLCSDGLFKTLSDKEITEIIRQNKVEPQNIAEELVSEVLKKEKLFQDNITVVILKYSNLT